GAGCYGWGQRVREQLRTRALREHVAQCVGTGHEAAGCAAECLAQGGGDDVHFAEHAEVLRCAASVCAQDTGAVRVVHDDDGVVIARDLEDLREPGNTAFHGKHAVRPDNTAPGGAVGLQLRHEVIHVGVPVDTAGALPDGLGQPDGVDDGRVVDCVRHHEVAFLHDAGGESFVRIPCRHVAQRRLGSNQACEPLFQVAMDGEGAADEAHA